MEKIKLIISREYWTRVKKRSFILATLLTPIGFGLLIFAQVMILKYQGSNEKVIQVVDADNLLNLKSVSMDTDLLYFKPSKKSVDELRTTLLDEQIKAGFDGILEIPSMKNINSTTFKINYYAAKNLGIIDEQVVKSSVKKRLRDYRIKELGLDKKVLKKIEFELTLNPKPLDNTAENKTTSITNKISYAIGMLMGFLMYIAVFVYGMMVLRSVMEEKTNRIVEVMISSVKPFQLMMGKIIGVGLVGITQVIIWVVLIMIINIVLSLFIGLDTPALPVEGAAAIDEDEMMYMIQQIMNELGNINWWLVLPLFLLYFIGGYLMYASLFAAVGSAMSDDMGESQSLTMPVSIPVIIAVFIMISAINAPDSTVATFGSIFPLFSPIVMPALLPMDLPWWQIALSVVLMIANVIFSIWLSAKIYRIGIFLYGKKVTLKELWKWIWY